MFRKHIDLPPPTDCPIPSIIQNIYTSYIYTHFACTLPYAAVRGQVLLFKSSPEWYSVCLEGMSMFLRADTQLLEDFDKWSCGFFMRSGAGSAFRALAKLGQVPLLEKDP